MLGKHISSIWAAGFLATSAAAAPVASNDVARAAARWARLNPLLGPATSVTTVTRPADGVYLVTFSPKGAAVFADDTSRAPCRWFTTGNDPALAVQAARATAAAPDPAGPANESSWAALLAARRASALSIPAGSSVSNVVGPLIPYKWSQERHYNRMCPLREKKSYPHLNDDRMYSGCVATAFAMYLAYYQWPFRGVGSTADKIEPDWLGGEADTACRTDFGADYDFAAMLPRYLITASQRETMAVAQLMADSGAILGLIYGDDSTSGDADDYRSALTDHFLYVDNYGVTVNPWAEASHMEFVKPTLARGEPILCNGQAGETENGDGVGHAYLCDGYCDVVVGTATNTYYHFNFGWNGSGNDWCTLDNVLTHATAGGDTQSYKVANMLVGVTPLGTPLFHRTPSVLSLSPTFSWEVANYWTNRLTGFTLERQVLQPVAVNRSIDGSGWTINDTRWGWKFLESKPTAYFGADWANNSYPTMGVNAYLTNGIAISSGTTLTLTYSAKKLDSGVKVYVTKCEEDGSVQNFASDNQTPSLVLATLSGGTSATAWTAKTTTMTGTGTLKPLAGQTNVKLCICFVDSNGNSSLYSDETPVLRIDSLTVTGTANDWVGKQTDTLAAAARSFSYTDLPATNHRFRLTANYTTTNFTAVLSAPTSATVTPPTISCAETANSLVYTIGNAAAYTYGFRYQNNSIKGTALKSGATLTYAFTNALTNYGTHWVECFVTNTVTGATATDYHIINLPAGSPLRPYAAFSYADALAKATAENKNIFMLSIADPYRSRFVGLEDALTSNIVVQAVATNFVYWENFAGDDEGAALCGSYWKQQPGPNWYTAGDTNSEPAVYAYCYLISPTNPAVQIPGDTLPVSYQGTTRWAYDNAQYDIQSVNAIEAESFRKFLTQPFAYPTLAAALTVLDSATGSALTNAALASAVREAVTNAAAGQLAGVSVIAIPESHATALYLLGLQPSVAVSGGRATAAVDYQFAITNLTLGAGGLLDFSARVYDNVAARTPPVRGRAALWGRASLGPDSDWRVLSSGILFQDGTFRLSAFDAATNRFFRFTVLPQ